MIAIKNGKVLQPDGSFLDNATVLVEGGQIKAVGQQVEVPADAEIVDATGKWVTPGLIDAHTHISTFNEPNWHRTRNDGNEMSGPIQSHLRGLDALNPFDYAIVPVREAGFTTCYTGPGSGNLIGGTGVAFKLRGKVADEMIIPGTEAMKMALGENAKTNYGPRDKSPMTRMGNAGVWREALANAKNYSDRLLAVGDDRTKIGKYDFELEALVPVVRGEMRCRIHAHRADDICTAIRVAEEFNLDYTIEHCTEGHLIAQQLKKEMPVINVGDTVRVHVKIKEGSRERIQVFEGIVIAKKHGGLEETFTVRRLAYGVGVEKVFPVHSPLIEKVETVRSGYVRRAKLYYLRGRVGKAAKIREKL